MDKMKSFDKYLLVSENLADTISKPHPNIDQIIIKPYLFYYVPKDEVDIIQKEGIKAEDGIDAYFARIPEIPKYQEFLKLHLPVKISVSKLIRSSDKVRVRGVNFPGYEDKELVLMVPQLEKMAEKTDKFFEFFENSDNLESVPKARIEFQNGVIPTFTFKILGPNIKEAYQMVSEIVASKKIFDMAETALKDLEISKKRRGAKLPRSVYNVLVATKKMKELKELLPMSKRLVKILGIDNPEFIAAKAILLGILRSNDSKSELISLSEN